MGGVAGGQKYLHNNIIYKFATDWHGIYGSDEGAMKAASHEMNGLMAVIDVCQCQHNDAISGCPIYHNWLSFPLTNLIDYQGFRLTAQAVLPINKRTLVYGSDDGGNHVIVSDQEISKRMHSLAERLNLRYHAGGVRADTIKNICFPTDIEVHKGSDGRTYMIDFARICPPTRDKQDQYRTSRSLTQHFRSEFLEKYKIALSADAFSKFCMHEPEKKQQEREIVEATEHLLTKIIPDFAKDVDKKFTKHVDIDQFLSVLKSAGINIRYLGELRTHVTSPFARNAILIEMICRSIKNQIREELRETKREARVLALEVYSKVVLKFFNRLLGAGDLQKSQAGWAQLRARLQNHFSKFPTDAEIKSELEQKEDSVVRHLTNNACTLLCTGTTFVRQISYKCLTCCILDDQGICESCAEKCHAQHNLTMCGISESFCDCEERTCCCRKPLPPVEHTDNPLYDKINLMGWDALFKRVAFLVGVTLSPQAISGLESLQGNFVFVLPDIAKLEVKSKQVTLISRAEANYLHLKSLMSSSKERARLFPLAMKRFEDSLRACPNSPVVIKEYADALCEQAFHDPMCIDFNLLHIAIKRYIALGHKDAIRELLKKLAVHDNDGVLNTLSVSEGNRDLQSTNRMEMYRACYALLLTEGSYKSAVGLDFVATYFKYLSELNLDSCESLNKDLATKLATGCSELRILNLSSASGVDDETIFIFSKNLKKLSKIVLDYLPITDLAIGHLAQYTSRLTSLSMSECSRITDNVNPELNKLSFLRTLVCSLCNCITRLYFGQNLESLEVLEARKCSSLAYVEGLKNIPRIYSLSLGYCPVLSDEFVTNVTTYLPHLEHVDFEGALDRITAKSVTKFLDYKSLLHINLAGCSVDPQVALSLLEFTVRNGTIKIGGVRNESHEENTLFGM
eukprot:TRINITY_DN3776_c0_g1_i2.p1 TRINITY_DN3776_c0_g1~~TRINITY_DN3776_c0_g1_i2.p1  ORF type:complete len:911 (+),score=104.39 TRINITY_DN3776_c0_g1_i2:727-3459(+)